MKKQNNFKSGKKEKRKEQRWLEAIARGVKTWIKNQEIREAKLREANNIRIARSLVGIIGKKRYFNISGLPAQLQKMIG